MNIKKKKRRRTSLSLNMGICTRTMGKTAVPISGSSLMGSHLYLSSAFFQKSFTTTITTPIYSLSMNTIIDIAKQMYTQTLSNGIISGAFISSHKTPNCPSPLKLFPEIPSIFGFQESSALCFQQICFWKEKKLGFKEPCFCNAFSVVDMVLVSPEMILLRCQNDTLWH